MLFCYILLEFSKLFSCSTDHNVKSVVRYSLDHLIDLVMSKVVKSDQEDAPLVNKGMSKDDEVGDDATKKGKNSHFI